MRRLSRIMGYSFLDNPLLRTYAEPQLLMRYGIESYGSSLKVGFRDPFVSRLAQAVSRERAGEFLHCISILRTSCLRTMPKSPLSSPKRKQAINNCNTTDAADLAHFIDLGK